MTLPYLCLPTPMQVGIAIESGKGIAVRCINTHIIFYWYDNKDGWCWKNCFVDCKNRRAYSLKRCVCCCESYKYNLEW